MSPNPSDAHAQAISYGLALRRAMNRRAMSVPTLARAVHVSAAMVCLYRRGRNLPSVDKAEQIADALGSPELATLAVRLRIGTCRVCRRAFRRERSRRVYCSIACRKAHHAGAVTLPRLDPRQAAIDAMCQGCEPDGECRDGTCALRPFSPLPVWRRRRSA